MSNITHLYHLSALDYVSAAFLGAPWSPSYTKSDILVATGAVENIGSGTTLIANNLVAHYVEALSMRRKMHTAGALFSGRQPIQNAMVPGGVTTLFNATYPVPATAADYDKGGPYNATETRSKFKALLKDVREFINQKYIPDVLTVANYYGTGATTLGTQNYFTQGQGCRRFLSYGDYPVDGAGTLAIKRGIVDVSASGFGAPATTTFDQERILEYIGNSYYTYGALDNPGLHPFDGRTNPNMKAAGYSWIKAPRYDFSGNKDGSDPRVMEVGPISRMVVSYVANDATVTANDGDTATGGVRIGGAYSVRQLVNVGLNAALGVFPDTNDVGTYLDLLPSVLGRHACRALESKFLADAMGHDTAGWAASLAVGGQCYTYAKIPKQVATGFGLCEAPRGALGHWIKVEGRKTAKYQCVVPSTWNFSPQSGAVANDYGTVEQALMDSNLGTTVTDQIVNILRVVHPFDCCIACAVHVVNPEGKETLKFAIGPDGKPTNIEVKE